MKTDLGCVATFHMGGRVPFVVGVVVGEKKDLDKI
jgi:hypothetical protein